jgi:CRISP-associated protein Cas1
MNPPVAAPPERASDDLVPVRALNQVSYCPRLYYLQYVEGLMPINEHVEDGLFGHRRVHDPDLQNRSLKAGGTETTRSVTLSSPTLGLIGKLDVLESLGSRETASSMSGVMVGRRWPST